MIPAMIGALWGVLLFAALIWAFAVVLFPATAALFVAMDWWQARRWWRRA